MKHFQQLAMIPVVFVFVAGCAGKPPTIAATSTSGAAAPTGAASQAATAIPQPTQLPPTPTAPATPTSVPPAPSPTAQSASTFFATAKLAEAQTIVTHSNGDLWPSCWADDDNLYAANGDGKGFGLSGKPGDVVVNRLSGPVDNLTGVALAKGNQVASIWGPDAQNYNRKPTGMLCVNGTLYLAVQDLRKSTFSDAPSASISKSTDHGLTWTWDTQAPMFKDGQFTTVFFLDFGKNNANAIDNYVYAYGLNNNWRAQDKLYLARVLPDQIQSRPAWQFYTGADPNGGGSPRWSAVFDPNAPVLQGDPGTISQGGVVYDKPLNRYIYTTWGGGGTATFNFYDAPKPWGPWERFLTKKFANTASSYGGYATTIPSKFISPDGETMWLQSNICIPCGNSVGNYAFALRKLVAVPNAAPAGAAASAGQ